MVVILLLVDIISCHRLGPYGHVAQLDSSDIPRDALECAYAEYARRTEILPPSRWRRPPGRPKQT